MIYDSAVIKTTLKKQTIDRVIAVQKGTVTDPETGKKVPVYTDEVQTFDIDNAPLKLDVPFRVYGHSIISNNEHIGRRLYDIGLDGTVVIAVVYYRVKDHVTARHLKSEKDVAEAFAGKIGKEWEKIKDNADIKAHWTLTKADALATYDKDGVKTPYKGADKDDSVPFAKWDGQVKAKVVEEGLGAPIVAPILGGG